MEITSLNTSQMVVTPRFNGITISQTDLQNNMNKSEVIIYVKNCTSEERKTIEKNNIELQTMATFTNNKREGLNIK